MRTPAVQKTLAPPLPRSEPPAPLSSRAHLAQAPAEPPPKPASRPIIVLELPPVLDAREAVRAERVFRGARGPHPIVWLDCSELRSASRAAVELLRAAAESAFERGVTLRLIGVAARLLPSLRGTSLERLVWPPATVPRPPPPPIHDGPPWTRPSAERPAMPAVHGATRRAPGVPPIRPKPGVTAGLGARCEEAG